MWVDWALIAAGAFFGALVVGSAGFAFAIIVTGIWIYVLPPAEVVLLASICATMLHALSVWRFRREIDYRRLWPFLIGGLLGVPLGVLALRNVNAPSFRHLFAVFMIAYVAYAVTRPRLPVVRFAPSRARIADGLIGWVSGVMGGLAMLHGTLPTIWCTLRGWDKRTSRCVYQPYILLMGVLVMALVGLNVKVDLARVTLNLGFALPALGAGLWLGSRVFDWISETYFQRLVLALILASAVALLL